MSLFCSVVSYGDYFYNLIVENEKTESALIGHTNNEKQIEVLKKITQSEAPLTEKEYLDSLKQFVDTIDTGGMKMFYSDLFNNELYILIDVSPYMGITDKRVKFKNNQVKRVWDILRNLKSIKTQDNLLYGGFVFLDARIVKTLTEQYSILYNVDNEKAFSVVLDFINLHLPRNTKNIKSHIGGIINLIDKKSKGYVPVKTKEDLEKSNLYQKYKKTIKEISKSKKKPINPFSSVSGQIPSVTLSFLIDDLLKAYVEDNKLEDNKVFQDIKNELRNAIYLALSDLSNEYHVSDLFNKIRKTIGAIYLQEGGKSSFAEIFSRYVNKNMTTPEGLLTYLIDLYEKGLSGDVGDEHLFSFLVNTEKIITNFGNESYGFYEIASNVLKLVQSFNFTSVSTEKNVINEDTNTDEAEEDNIEDGLEDGLENTDSYDFTAEDLYREVPPLAVILSNMISNNNDATKTYMSYLNHIIMSGSDLYGFSKKMNEMITKDIENGSLNINNIQDQDIIFMHALFGVGNTDKPISTFPQECVLLFKDIDRKVTSYVPVNNLIKTTNGIYNNYNSENYELDPLIMISKMFLNSYAVYDIYYRLKSDLTEEEREKLAEDIASFFKEIYKDVNVPLNLISKYSIYFVIKSQKGYLENMFMSMIQSMPYASTNYLSLYTKRIRYDNTIAFSSNFFRESVNYSGFVYPFVVSEWVDSIAVKQGQVFDGNYTKQIPGIKKAISDYYKTTRQGVSFFYKTSFNNAYAFKKLNAEVFNILKTQNINLTAYHLNRVGLLSQSKQYENLLQFLMEWRYNEQIKSTKIEGIKDPTPVDLNQETKNKLTSILNEITTDTHVASEFLMSVLFNSGVSNISLLRECFDYERRKSLEGKEKPGKYDIVLGKITKYIEQLIADKPIYRNVFNKLDLSQFGLNKISAFLEQVYIVETILSFNILDHTNAVIEKDGKVNVPNIPMHMLYHQNSVVTREVTKYRIMYLSRLGTNQHALEILKKENVARDRLDRYTLIPEPKNEDLYEVATGNLALVDKEKVKGELKAVVRADQQNIEHTREVLTSFINYLNDLSISVVRNTTGGGSGKSTRSLRFTMSNQVFFYALDVNDYIQGKPIGQGNLISNMAHVPVLAQIAKERGLRIAGTLFRGFDSYQFSKLNPYKRTIANLLFFTHAGDVPTGTSQDKSTVPTLSFTFGNEKPYTVSKKLNSGIMKSSTPDHIGIPGYYMISSSLKRYTYNSFRLYMDYLDAKTEKEKLLAQKALYRKALATQEYKNSMIYFRYNAMFSGIYDKLHEIIQTDVVYYLYFKTIQQIEKHKEDVYVERLWGETYGNVDFKSSGKYTWRYLINELDLINSAYSMYGLGTFDVEWFVTAMSRSVDSMSLAFYEKAKKIQERVFSDDKKTTNEKNLIFANLLKEEIKNQADYIIRNLFDFKNIKFDKIQKLNEDYDKNHKQYVNGFLEMLQKDPGNFDNTMDSMAASHEPNSINLRVDKHTMAGTSVDRHNALYYFKAAAIGWQLNKDAIKENHYEESPQLVLGFLGMSMFNFAYLEGANVIKNLMNYNAVNSLDVENQITKFVNSFVNQTKDTTLLEYILRSGHFVDKDRSLMFSFEKENKIKLEIENSEEVYKRLGLKKVLRDLNVVGASTVFFGYAFSGTRDIQDLFGKDDITIADDQLQQEYLGYEGNTSVDLVPAEFGEVTTKVFDYFNINTLLNIAVQYALLSNVAVTLTEFSRGYLYNNDIGEKANKRITATTSPGVTFEMTDLKKRLLHFYFGSEFKQNTELGEYLKPIIENETLHVANYEDTRSNLISDESTRGILISYVRDTFKGYEGYADLESQNGFSIIPLEVYKAMRILQHKWTDKDEAIYQRVINDTHNLEDIQYIAENYRPFHADKNQFSGFQIGRAVLVNTNLKHMAFPFHPNLIPFFDNRETMIQTLENMKKNKIHMLTAISGTKTNKLTTMVAKASNQRKGFEIEKETGVLTYNQNYVYVPERLPIRYFKENTPIRNESKDEVYLNIKTLFYGFMFVDNMVEVEIGDNLLTNIIKEAYAISYGKNISDVDIKDEDFIRYYQDLRQSVLELKNTFFASFIDNKIKKAKYIKEETGYDLVNASDEEMLKYVKRELSKEGYSGQQIEKMLKFVNTDILLEIGPVKKTVNALLKIIDKIRKVPGDKHILVPDFFNTHYHPGDTVEPYDFHTNHLSGVHSIGVIISTKQYKKSQLISYKEVTYTIKDDKAVTLYEYLKKHYDPANPESSLVWLSYQTGYNIYYLNTLISDLENEKENLSRYYVYELQPNNAITQETFLEKKPGVIRNKEDLTNAINTHVSEGRFVNFVFTYNNQNVGCVIGKIGNTIYYNLLTDNKDIEKEITKALFEKQQNFVKITKTEDPNKISMFSLNYKTQIFDSHGGILLGDNNSMIIIDGISEKLDKIKKIILMYHSLLTFYAERNKKIHDIIFEDIKNKLKFEGESKDLIPLLVKMVNEIGAKADKDRYGLDSFMLDTLEEYGLGVSLKQLLPAPVSFGFLNPQAYALYRKMTDVGISDLEVSEIIEETVKRNLTNLIFPMIQFMVDQMYLLKSNRHVFYNYGLSLKRSKSKDLITYSVPEVRQKESKEKLTVVTKPVKQYTSVTKFNLPLFFLKLPGNVVVGNYGVKLLNLILKEDIDGIIDLAYADKKDDAKLLEEVRFSVSYLKEILKGYLRSVAYRVPTQNISSLINSETVGFFHPGVGSAATTNSFILGSQGSDCDNDSNTNVYVSSGLYIENKSKKLTDVQKEIIEESKTIKGIQAIILDKEKYKAFLELINDPGTTVSLIDDPTEYQSNNMVRSLYKSLTLPFNQMNKLLPVVEGPLITLLSQVAKKKDKYVIPATERSVSASSMVRDSLDKIGAVVFLQNVFASKRSTDTFGMSVSNPYLYEIMGEMVTLVVDVPSKDIVKYIRACLDVNTIAHTLGVLNYYFYNKFDSYKAYKNYLKQTSYQISMDQEVYLDEEKNKPIKIKDLYTEATRKFLDYILTIHPYIEKLTDEMKEGKMRSHNKKYPDDVAAYSLMSTFTNAYSDKIKGKKGGQYNNIYIYRNVKSYVKMMYDFFDIDAMIKEVHQETLNTKSKYFGQIAADIIKNKIDEINFKKLEKKDTTGIVADILGLPDVQMFILDKMKAKAEKKPGSAIHTDINVLGAVFANMYYHLASKKSKENIEMSDFKKMGSPLTTNYFNMPRRNPEVAHMVTGYYNTNQLIKFILRPLLRSNENPLLGKRSDSSIFEMYLSKMLLENIQTEYVLFPIGGTRIASATDSMQRLLLSKTQDAIELIKRNSYLTNHMVFELGKEDMFKLKDPYYTLFSMFFTMMENATNLVEKLEELNKTGRDERLEETIKQLRKFLYEINEIVNTSVSKNLKASSLSKVNNTLLTQYFDATNYAEVVSMFNKILFTFYNFGKSLNQNISNYAFLGASANGFRLFQNISITSDPTSSMLAYSDSKNERMINGLVIFLTNNSTYRTPTNHSDLLKNITVYSKVLNDDSFTMFYKSLITFISNGFRVGIMNTIEDALYRGKPKDIGYLLPMALPYVEYVTEINKEINFLRTLTENSTRVSFTKQEIKDIFKSLYIRKEEIESKEKDKTKKEKPKRKINEEEKRQIIERVKKDVVFAIMAVPFKYEDLNEELEIVGGEDKNKRKEIENEIEKYEKPTAFLKKMLLYGWGSNIKREWVFNIKNMFLTDTEIVEIQDKETLSRHLERPYFSVYYFDSMMKIISGDSKLSEKYKNIINNSDKIRRFVFMYNMAYIRNFKMYSKESEYVKGTMAAFYLGFNIINDKSDKGDLVNDEYVKEFYNLMNEYYAFINDDDVLSLVAKNHSNVIDIFVTQNPTSLKNFKRATSVVKEPNDLIDSGFFQQGMGLWFYGNEKDSILLSPENAEEYFNEMTGTVITGLKQDMKALYRNLKKMKDLKKSYEEKRGMMMEMEKSEDIGDEYGLLLTEIQKINQVIERTERQLEDVRNKIIFNSNLTEIIEETRYYLPKNASADKEKPVSTDFSVDIRGGKGTYRLYYDKGEIFKNPIARAAFEDAIGLMFKYNQTTISYETLLSHFESIKTYGSNEMIRYVEGAIEHLNVAKNTLLFELSKAIGVIVSKSIEKNEEFMDPDLVNSPLYLDYLYRAIGSAFYQAEKQDKENTMAKIVNENLNAAIEAANVYRASQYLYSNKDYRERNISMLKDIDTFYRNNITYDPMPAFSDVYLDINMLYDKYRLSFDKESISKMTDKQRYDESVKTAYRMMGYLLEAKKLHDVKRATSFIRYDMEIFDNMVKAIEKDFNVTLGEMDRNNLMKSYADLLLKYFDIYIPISKDTQTTSVTTEIEVEEDVNRITVIDSSGYARVLSREEIISYLKETKEYADVDFDEFSNEMLKNIYSCYV